MPGYLTEITEVATALGMLAPDLATALRAMPDRLRNVDEAVWARLVAASIDSAYETTFETAFQNGVAFLEARDGLRRRHPLLVEWKGPHRVPGDDVIPGDIRIDHVYQVSCKYLSKITQNCGPSRLFDRLLVGEQRSSEDWFSTAAPVEYQTFYESIRDQLDAGLPDMVGDLEASHRAVLKTWFARTLPAEIQPSWRSLCAAVSAESARRWNVGLSTPTTRLRMLWRLLRIGDAPYFVLGTDGHAHVRLRVASAWDWMQSFELESLTVSARDSGQPEVGWTAAVRDRSTRVRMDVSGHVEIRWSHGRLQGAPEAKVYLDTPFPLVPGYFALE
jgi:hypothetical protein